MAQTEVVLGVTLVHDPGRTLAQLADSSYLSDPLEPRYFDAEGMGFSDDIPISIWSAGIATIVAIREAEGNWGLYSGLNVDEQEAEEAVIIPGDRENILTLEEFLRAWQIQKKSPVELAFIFGASYFDPRETSAYRTKIIEAVQAATQLPREKIITRWTNLLGDEEIDVAVHPAINTIRLNEENPALATAS